MTDELEQDEVLQGIDQGDRPDEPVIEPEPPEPDDA